VAAVVAGKFSFKMFATEGGCARAGMAGSAAVALIFVQILRRACFPQLKGDRGGYFRHLAGQKCCTLY
jgi:hypothetical protein